MCQPGGATQLYADGVAQMLVAVLVRLWGERLTAEPGGLVPWQINRVMNLMSANDNRHLSIQDLADVVGLSYAQFAFLWKYRRTGGRSIYVSGAPNSVFSAATTRSRTSATRLVMVPSRHLRRPSAPRLALRRENIAAIRRHEPLRRGRKGEAHRSASDGPQGAEFREGRPAPEISKLISCRDADRIASRPCPSLRQSYGRRRIPHWCAVWRSLPSVRCD